MAWCRHCSIQNVGVRCEYCGADLRGAPVAAYSNPLAPFCARPGVQLVLGILVVTALFLGLGWLLGHAVGALEPVTAGGGLLIGLALSLLVQPIPKSVGGIVALLLGHLTD
jgi:hypothetical protein